MVHAVIEWPSATASPDGELQSLSPTARVNSTARTLLELPLMIFVVLLSAVLLKTFIAQAFFIPSPSMEPQLTEGDRVLVSRTAYRLHDPRRGDVLVFDEPGSDGADDRFILLRWGNEALEAVGAVSPPNKQLIKRVVGLPGEIIEAKNNVLYIDGRPLAEPYIGPNVLTADFGPELVPGGHLFMMGDNRTNSRDSRIIGAVDMDLVVGRAMSRVWPPGRIAYL